MEKRSFHVSTVLSVIHDRLVSIEHTNDLCEMLGFMLDRPVRERKISIAAEKCRPYLLKHYPVLGSPMVKKDIDILVGALKICSSSNEESAKIFSKWLLKIAEKYGERFDVTQIPPDACGGKLPIRKEA